LSVDMSSVRRGGGKIPRYIDFNTDWENLNVNTLRFVGRFLRKVDKFLEDCTVSDTTRRFIQVLVCVGKAVNPSLFHMLYSWTRRMTHESITIRIIGFLTQLSKIRVIYLALSITQEWKHFCQSRRRAGIVCGVMLLHVLIIRSCKFHNFSVMLYFVYLISLRLQTNTAHVSVR
jgi:hypothetical protein